ncbi:MAG: glycerol-3-phosphate acyltransferase [Dehalococcoidales bacterium]
MAIRFVLLILGAYLVSSVPLSYIAAKLSRGIDLRQYGTGQVGAGNLWRLTSWRLALPIGLFDLSKGLMMVWVAQLVGLNIPQQLTVGLAAIIGHNWPIFLRFSGGRGVGTAIGVVLILPIINEMTPWATVAFLTIIIIGTVITRSSPLPVLVAAAALPLVSWSLEPPSVTLGFLAIFVIIVVKRLTAPRSAEAALISRGQLLVNRLLFDRDIGDRKAWMYRTPREASSTEQSPEEQGQGKG